MDVVGEAPRLIAALFEDEGRSVLDEGELGESWRDALQHVPPELLDVPPEDAGRVQLGRLRDFWSRLDDLRPALAATRGLLDVQVTRHGPEHPDALVELGALGALVQRAGRADEGAAMLERAFDGLRSAAGGSDLRLAVVSSNLGLHYVRAGRAEDAERVLGTAYRIRSVQAPETAGLAAAQLGELRMRAGRLADALPLLREAWQRSVEQQGPDHPRTAARAHVLGALYARLGRHSDAARLLRTAWEAARGDSERAAGAAMELGVALCQSGAEEEGLRRVEEAIRWTREASRAEPHPTLPARLTAYAQLQLQRGRPGEAEGILLEALEAEKRLNGDDSPQVADRYAVLGNFCARSGRGPEALGWLDAAASLLRTALGDAHPRTRQVVQQQSGLLVATANDALKRRDRALASELLARAWSLAEPVLGQADARVREIRELRRRHRL